jgi:hypothetical protein
MFISMRFSSLAIILINFLVLNKPHHNLQAQISVLQHHQYYVIVLILYEEVDSSLQFMRISYCTTSHI